MDLFSVQNIAFSEVIIGMKEFLIYKLNKDLILYNTNYQHVLIFNPVIYKLEHNGGLMSSQAKLNYKGHYMYPDMCHCTTYSTVSSDQWKIFTCPSLHFVFNYPSFLNLVIRNGHMQCITVVVSINL